MTVDTRQNETTVATMRNAQDYEIEEGISAAVFGSIDEFNDALDREDKPAMALQRGLAVRLRSREREATEKFLNTLAEQLSDGLEDVRIGGLLPPDLIDDAAKFAERLRDWKDPVLFELLHDLQRALSGAEGSEKAKAVRVESLVRAIREAINWQPAPKEKPVKEEAPKPMPIVTRFKTALGSARV